MDPSELTTYLHDHIPLTAAMGLTTAAAEPERVALDLPLAANRNHKGTMFGGSLAALATLACWSLIHVRMRKDQLAGDLVVSRSTMAYTAPVLDACQARCVFADEAAWDKCRRLLLRRGRSRMELTSELFSDGQSVATFSGEFGIVTADALADTERR
ncbi:MAG: YiiD C-terminal domain-containing protein [Pseudomonadota bacterium]